VRGSAGSNGLQLGDVYQSRAVLEQLFYTRANGCCCCSSSSIIILLLLLPPRGCFRGSKLKKSDA
jgi:hypothetical protein